MSNYSEKLKDPRWQEKRLRVFERDGFQCTECPGKGTLHCHHKRYLRGCDPWDIDITYLTTLCEGCHELEEELKRTNPEIKLYAELANVTCVHLWKWIKTISFLHTNHQEDYDKLADYGNENILKKFGKVIWSHGATQVENV